MLKVKIAQQSWNQGNPYHGIMESPKKYKDSIGRCKYCSSRQSCILTCYNLGKKRLNVELCVEKYAGRFCDEPYNKAFR